MLSGKAFLSHQAYKTLLYQMVFFLVEDSLRHLIGMGCTCLRQKVQCPKIVMDLDDGNNLFNARVWQKKFLLWLLLISKLIEKKL